MAPPFQALHCWKQILSHVGVGMGAASFWRGAWYILDDQLFPDNPNHSALSSLALGTCGMAASQGLVSRAMAVRNSYLKPVARFGALYVVAMSCVLVWRGTWVGWDCVYEHYHNVNKHHHQNSHDAQRQRRDSSTLTTTATTTAASSSSALEHSPAHTAVKSTDPGHLTSSGLASHGFAIVALSAAGVFASVLAPPAAVSVIKDLAVQTSRRSSSFASSNTTQQRALNYFHNNARRRTGTGQVDVSNSSVSSSGSLATTVSNNRALEFIPSLAGYYMSTSRSITTQTAGLFRSTTGTFTKGGARLP